MAKLELECRRVEIDINPSANTRILRHAIISDSIKLSISTGNQFFFEQFIKKIKIIDNITNSL